MQLCVGQGEQLRVGRIIADLFHAAHRERRLARERHVTAVRGQISRQQGLVDRVLRFDRVELMQRGQTLIQMALQAGVVGIVVLIELPHAQRNRIGQAR